jgi:hypothetical protein
LADLSAPNPGNVRGLRDDAPSRSELTSIRFEYLEKTDRGIGLTLPLTKGDQTDAVTVPRRCGDTKFCPVHALELWQQPVRPASPATGPDERPAFSGDTHPPASAQIIACSISTVVMQEGLGSPAPDIHGHPKTADKFIWIAGLPDFRNAGADPPKPKPAFPWRTPSGSRHC